MNNGPIEPFDHLGHSVVIQRIRRITRLAVVLVTIKGTVSDHDGRIAECPVTLVVGKTNAGNNGRGRQGFDRDV